MRSRALVRPSAPEAVFESSVYIPVNASANSQYDANDEKREATRVPKHQRKGKQEEVITK